MNINDIISSGLLELYASGIASPEEALQVEQWLQQYPEARQELNDIEMSLESYAQANAITPSAGLKDKILAGVDEDGAINTSSFQATKTTGTFTDPKVYRIPSFFKIAAAAMLALLIGSIVLNYSYYNKYQSANNELQVAQQKIDKQEQANVALRNDMDVVSDKNSLPVVLKGTPHAPEALAKIFWMRNTGDVYIDPTNLPAVPAGKQYQLWAIVDGNPVSAGVISTAKGVYHIQKMKSFGHAEAFAITLEKEGGSEKPTMDQMFVISKI